MDVALQENPGVRRLIGGWLLLALAALALSTVYAVLVVLTRTPLLNSFGVARELFRNSLVLHVNFAVIVWLLVCAAGLWTLAAGGVSHGRRAALLLACIGAAGMAVTPLFGTPPAILSNYVPVLDSRIFLAGLACFAAGVTLCGAASIGDIVRRLRAGQHDIWRIGALLSIIIAAVVLGSLAGSMAMTGIPVNQEGFDTLFWGPGHVLQFLHVVLMMTVWSVLGERVLGHPVAPQRWLVGLLLLAALPMLSTPFIHVTYSVGAIEFRHAFTSLMKWGTWPAAALLAGRLLWQLGRAGRKVWVRPETLPLALSLLLFFIGCLLGAAIKGETTLVTAHYHGTVGAVAVAYMGLGYRLLPAFGLPDAWRLGRWQLAVYGSGLLMLASSLAWLGSMGVPRKTPHVDQAAQTAASMTAMGLMGVGSLLSLIGIALFIFAIGRSIWPRDRKSVPRKSTGDVRWRALLLTVGATVAIGLLISMLPGKDYTYVPDPHAGTDLRTTAENPVAQQLESAVENKTGNIDTGKTPQDAYAAHSWEKGSAEIEQRFQQGVIMLHAKRYDDAITAFHRVLLLNPDLTEANVNMGFALIGLERYKAARDFFEAAIELRKDQINAYYGLALALTGTNDVAGAIGAMRTYRHLASADDPYRDKADELIKEWEGKRDQQRDEATPAQ